MDGFGVFGFVPPVSNVTSPTGWLGTVDINHNRVDWVAYDVADPDVVPLDGSVPASNVQVSPGGTLSGFSFKSPKPPGAASFRAIGFAPVPSQIATGDQTAEDAAEALLEACPSLNVAARDRGIVGSTRGPATSLLVMIDVKPGSEVNPVNPNTQGVLPLAVLGSATFDVQTIAATSLQLGHGVQLRRTAGRSKMSMAMDSET